LNDASSFFNEIAVFAFKLIFFQFQQQYPSSSLSYGEDDEEEEVLQQKLPSLFILTFDTTNRF
jgi:hypothetical protein